MGQKQWTNCWQKMIFTRLAVEAKMRKIVAQMATQTRLPMMNHAIPKRYYGLLFGCMGLEVSA